MLVFDQRKFVHNRGFYFVALISAYSYQRGKCYKSIIEEVKLQDLVFFVVLAILFWKRDQRLLVAAGLVVLVLSVPLFATWTFFTAERLTWYAAALFLLSIIFNLIKLKKNE